MQHGVRVRKVCGQCGKLLGEEVRSTDSTTNGPITVTAAYDETTHLCDTCSFFSFLTELRKRKEGVNEVNVRAG